MNLTLLSSEVGDMASLVGVSSGPQTVLGAQSWDVIFQSFLAVSPQPEGHLE